jgi:hypothetical protein
MKINFYEFFKTRDFLFLKIFYFRKLEKDLYLGYILVRQQMGKRQYKSLKTSASPIQMQLYLM